MKIIYIIQHFVCQNKEFQIRYYNKDLTLKLRPNKRKSSDPILSNFWSNIDIVIFSMIVIKWLSTHFDDNDIGYLDDWILQIELLILNFNLA